ncbi:MAG: hypothetical protein NVSMB57_13130 [Actinomycetota bacterium]
MLARESSSRLAAYAVWVPQLGAGPWAVPGGVKLVPDTRVHHYWDGGDVLGRAYGKVLPTPGAAWDVYLLYPRGVRWSASTPPKPAFWMHQLGGVTAAPRLDPDVFRGRVEQALRA